MAEQMREAFRASGMTIKALTVETGLFYSATYRFVRGDADLTLTGATKICDVLGLALKQKRKRK